MKLNFISVTIWFNIYDDINKLLNNLQNNFKNEYTSYQVNNVTNNLGLPIIIGNNDEIKSSLLISQINLQFNQKINNINDIDSFKDKVLNLLNILELSDVKLCHSSIFVNNELICDDALTKLTSNILNKNIIDDNLVDTNIKIGKKSEDLFYKIITIYNKKQIKIPKLVDDRNRLVPIPLISLNGMFTENELLDISYEINDKYLFDFTKDYHTNDFYLNKMFFNLKRDYLDDINNLLDNGKF